MTFQTAAHFQAVDQPCDIGRIRLEPLRQLAHRDRPFQVELAQQVAECKRTVRAKGTGEGKTSLLKKSTEASSTMPINHAAQMAAEPMIQRQSLGARTCGCADAGRETNLLQRRGNRLQHCLKENEGHRTSPFRPESAREVEDEGAFADSASNQPARAADLLEPIESTPRPLRVRRRPPLWIEGAPAHRTRRRA